MRITDMKDAKYMSAIIGVCGTNFCTFVSDGRVVSPSNGGWKPAKDDFRKIIQINDRLIYGATGVFNKNESLLDPLSVYPDRAHLTMRLALKAILGHIERIKDEIPSSRCYLLGGKDNKGNFCICEVFINFETRQLETIVRKPERVTESASTFGISCALPTKLIPEKDFWVDKVGACVLDSGHHRDMVTKVSEVIRDIARIDGTVGGEIYTLTVR